MKHIRFVIFALAAVLTTSCCNKEVKPSDPAGSFLKESPSGLAQGRLEELS